MTIDFTITFNGTALQELEKESYEDGLYNGVDKLLKLYCFQNTGNIRCFDPD